MMEKTLHCRITGRVQGVCFRMETQKQARKRGIKGWARNCADGSVELMATGEETSLHQLLAWLGQGPPLATVDEVESLWLTLTPFDDFTIR